MSGFTAIFQRDGRPLDTVQLHRMNDAIRHRGPDGTGCWVDGSVGLAHQMMRTTPEAGHETQPAISADADLVLIYEGLIDNCDAIRDAARATHLRVADKTDATAILLAYQLWGDDCVTKLSGDFAFVIWDRRVRRLFCARDPLGIRPFYYHLDDRLFACGSELRQLLCHSEIQQRPNEGMAAEYLSNAVTSVTETLYRDIQRMPAGHSLRVESGRYDLRRYWHFNPTRQIRFRTDEEYGEALLEELRTAVRACARTSAPLGIEVSGGLDSTSVASIVRQLAARGDVTMPVETFNLAYPGLDCDEAPYVNAFDQRWRCDTKRVVFALSTPSDFDASLAAHRDFPECPNGVMHYPLYRTAREHGCRVLLGGRGGDEILAGHRLHYADWVKRMELGRVRRQMRDDRMTLRGLIKYGLRPLAPAPIRWAARTLRRGYPEWIASSFANDVGLADRVYRPRFARQPWQSRAQEEMFRDLNHGWVYYCAETLSRVMADHGLEYRSPFLRLNLVEFGLGLPEEQRWRGVETKVSLRHAMKGLLPENIRTRKDKAEFGAIFPTAFSKLDSSSVFQSLRLVSLGWLDGPCVKQMYSPLASWHPGIPVWSMAIWPLWMIFGIECWLTRAAAK